MSDAVKPSIKVEFELEAADLDFFRDQLKKARGKRVANDDGSIISGAEATITQALGSNPPRYIRERLGELQPLIDMLKDADWALKGDDRARVLDALAYFSEAEDIIPDATPGIGYLDDAIMIDLVSRELAPELEAYADFCANREDLKAGEPDATPLAEARDLLQSRMRRRRRRMSRGRVPQAQIITSLFHA